MELIHYDFSTTEKTIESIRKEALRQGLGLPEQQAYILATIDWETAETFKPIIESYWKTEQWRKQNFTYFPFYGRGFIQLTWLENYKKYSEILGVDLVHYPEKTLDPDISLFIAIHGFKNGTFTGKKLEDYINDKKIDLFNSRRCINGIDHAQDIADKAEEFM